MLRRPRCPTPLPHTRLLRSPDRPAGVGADRAEAKLARDRRGGAARGAAGNEVCIRALAPPGRDDGTETGRLVRRAHGEDRKSTRLNSSHQIISYAVFCLKKK